MKISFDISEELAQSLLEECAICRTSIEEQSERITPNDFAKDCLESELASRRLAQLPQVDRPTFLMGEKKSRNSVDMLS
jgi:hypothetical protein